jgi:hypothetical protein
MLILLYYNLIYLCLLYFKLNQNLVLCCVQICCCIFVYSCALVCWFVVVCSYDYNSDVTCIHQCDYKFDVAWIYCCDYNNDVIWVYYYSCSYDIGSIWSSCSFSILCSLVCIYSPISIVVNPYSWELTSCGIDFNGSKLCYDTYFIPPIF